MSLRTPLYGLLVAAALAVTGSAQILGNGRFGSGTVFNPGASAGDMSATANISGQVRGFDNRPVKDARIEIREVTTGATIGSAYTRPDGSFELSGVPRGAYEVVATHGLSEARQRLELTFAEVSVDLRLNEHPDTSAGSANTVSVAQLQVPKKARDVLRDAQKDFDKAKYEQARQHVDKALEIYPRYADALALRGILGLRDQKLDQATADLEKAISYDPNLGLAYLALGSAYNNMNRFEDALQTLEHGTSLTPAAWQVQYETARAYLGKGEFADALRHADRAENLAPKHYPPVHLIKADACLGLKDYAGAIAQFEQYLSTNPTGPNATLARERLDQAKAFAGTR